jgi:type VI secretion system secreted protein Hcp
MAVDMFLKLDGVQGESVSDKHKGEIDILSFSWGLSQTGTAGHGGGGGAGKVSVQDLSIVKALDASSPQLMEMCCRGEHASYATLTLARTGGKEQTEDYFKIKLSDVLISSYQTGGASNGVPAEQVSFTFASVEVSSLDAKGQFQPSAACDFHKGR